MESIKDLFNKIGEIAYNEFVNNDELPVKTNYNFNQYTGYCEVSFVLEGINFHWSVNNKNFVCQHSPYKFDFTEEMEANIVKRTQFIVKKNSKENREKQIEELEKTLEMLKNEDEFM